jgi:hypothetical protein
MASIVRPAGRGNLGVWGSAAKIRVVVLAAALAMGALGLMATQAAADAGHGNACPPSSHNPGGEPPCGFPPASEPPAEPAPTPSTITPEPVSHVAATVHKGHAKTTAPAPAPAPHPTVIVPPRANPKAPVVKHAAKPKYRHPVGPGFRGQSSFTPVAAPASAGNPDRSTFAHRLLSPTHVDLSAENLGEGGLLALLLAALLYLPVTIFNKATEKNHETIKGWFERPRAVLAAAFGWIPVSRHPGLTLTGGVIASAGLFAFIEPGFPTEPGALQYLVGMMIGFALVSVVFFVTWRIVLKRLEPDGEGEWRIFPPYILLAAFLVVMARLAHFIPGVVLGTVAEYEPAKRLSVRTAGIRVAVTYGALTVLGLAAWFAWVPVEHAAAKEGASSVTLILDSALAVTFVSALESVAFGLIPMTFLDGNDLFRWHRGLWAALWGGALVWFSVVIMHPALSTYQEHSHSRIVWFVLLFSALMLVALATWGYFRVREARATAAAS